MRSEDGAMSEECRCVCFMHRAVASVRCRMIAETRIIVESRVIHEVPIEMCEPCGVWWLETQLGVRQGEPL